MGSRAVIRSKNPIERALRGFEFWPAFLAHVGAIAMAAYCIALPSDESDMFGWAQLVRRNGAPDAIFETWLPRGFGYKLIVYAQYTVAHWFAGFVSGADITFYAGNLFIVAAIALVAAIATLTLRGTKGFGAESGDITAPTLFSCLFMLLCAMPVRAFGQPEHFALLFSVLLGCLVLASVPLGRGRFIAVVLLTVAAASLKGLTALFLAPVWLLALTSPGVSPSKFWRLTFAMIAGVVVYAVCLVSVPRELPDLLADSSFQAPFEFNVHTVWRLIRCLANYTYCQPSWLVVSIFAIALAWLRPDSAGDASWLGRFRTRTGTALVAGAAGLIALLYVFVQQEFLSYHFVGLHLIGVLTILFLAIAWGQRRYAVALSILSALPAALLSFAPHQVSDSFVGSARALQCIAANGKAVSAALHAEGYDGTEPILFLAGGGLNNFIDAPSYDRYFIQLPLSRGADDTSLAATPVYRQTLRHVLSFRGRFIVWNPDWMDFDDTPGLQEMVIPAYQPVALHGSCNVNGLLLERVSKNR